LAGWVADDDDEGGNEGDDDGDGKGDGEGARSGAGNGLPAAAAVDNRYWPK
jgi:hypothetical protein